LQDREGHGENPGPVKTCTACDRTFPLGRFYRAAKGKHGRTARCVGCVKEYRDSRSADHSAYMASYREKNRDRMNAQERAWYEKNKPHHSSQHRAWYLANRENVIEHQRAYYLANRMRYRAWREAWALANKNALKVIRSRRVNNKYVQALHRITEEMLLGRLAVFGYACAYCGGPHEHWDHVKPLSKGGSHMIGNLRPSCQACNLRKGSKLPGHWFRLLKRLV